MGVSGRVPDGAGDESAPYFFLSYARHHHSGEDKADKTRETDKAQEVKDPDRWTLRFFEDLTYEVAELTTLPRGTRPGFMDRDVRIGQQWRRRISEALAACRVFVPLYTPRYFTSLSCASEWYLFQARQSAHELTSGARPEAIVPVLWLPIPETELPEAARALQFDHHSLGEAYARLGFLQLIRLGRYEDDYQLAIHALARHVVRVAHGGAPRAARPVDFTALHGRFESADGLFEAAGELVRRAGRSTPAPLSLPGPRPPLLPGVSLPGTSLAGTQQLALPPGRLWRPPGPSDSSLPSNSPHQTSDQSSATGPDADGGSEPAEPSAPSEPPKAAASSGPIARYAPIALAAPIAPVSPGGGPDGEAGPDADAAVAAYLRAAHTKLAEWFTGRPEQVSAGDFDEFYFREVHPAAKAALLRQLTPHAPAGPFPRPPRLRAIPVADPPSGGPPHAP